MAMVTALVDITVTTGTTIVNSSIPPFRNSILHGRTCSSLVVTTSGPTPLACRFGRLSIFSVRRPGSSFIVVVASMPLRCVHPCTILIAFSLFPFLSNKSEMDFSKLIVVLGLATLSHFCSKKSDTAFSKWSVVMCLATVFYLSIKCRDGFRAQETKAACSSVANLHGCIWTSDQLDL